MSIRFIHAADFHYDRENQDAAAKSLEAIIAAGRERKVHFFALAGDLFNRGIANSEAGGLPRLLDLIQRMLDVAPIFAVSGTPTHDLPGCYEPLLRLSSAEANTFNLMKAGDSIIFEACEDKCIIQGIPEPGKEWFLADSNGIGKAEADQKVIQGIRGILLGLGAKRAEHPELPCVMLYHGMVAGSAMANGQIIEGGISIGREDLALVGADYYALGHIHEWQQISGMSAYYSGSAYPVNWGEVTQKRFNLVEVDDSDSSIEVTPLPFPHPPRKKIVVDYYQDGKASGAEGFQTWLVVKKPKESSFDEQVMLDTLLFNGALPGSRVTVEIISTETVRAASITSKHRLRDKLCVYADASADEVLAETILEKADALERADESAGAVEGAHIRLRRLRLRGAIGIWRGQGVDEIVLDFDAYDPGLIALMGVNGAGKTTLIENCHPFPSMLTRDGTLQEHFRLRDSARELWFVDERTGAEYRALILVDGKNASGACEYHLFKDGQPLTNGRKADYEAAITKLFGSRELFLRSAFVSQKSTKSNPDLAEATKGEKKEIFRELAGLDYLQGYAESAAAEGDAIQDKIALDRARSEITEIAVGSLPGIRTERQQGLDQVDAGRISLADLERSGSALKLEAERLGKELQNQRLTQQKIESLTEQNRKRDQAVADAEQNVFVYAEATKRKDAAEHIIDAHTKLTLEEAQENERISGIRKERERLISEHKDASDTWGNACRTIESKKSGLRTEIARLEGDRELVQTRIRHLTEALTKPVNSECPECHQFAHAGTCSSVIKLVEERAQNELKLTESRAKFDEIGPKIAEKEAENEALLTPPAPTAPELPAVDEKTLQRIRGQIQVMKVEDAQKLLATAQEAAAATEVLMRQIQAAASETQAAEQVIDSLKETIDAKLEADSATATAALEEARREYADAKAEVAAKEAEVRALDKRILELEVAGADLEKVQDQIEASTCELGEWRYLERACGVDGIQALELDALGPGIAETANRLLASAYGARFAIEFRTTRLAGKGSKTRQVEDFSIWIHDGDTEQELSTLSGGESVWIKRAIFDAFGLVRDRNTGTRFLTVFADEADGALDAGARSHYFDMLAAAHQESGRRHTIVISHSPEAQEMIRQRIDIRELAKSGIPA